MKRRNIAAGVAEKLNNHPNALRAAMKRKLVYFTLVKDAVKGGVLKRNQILPTVLIVIDLAAAVLTWSVTW
ncbi:MAG: hypothetical protein WC998_08090 [Candidatus Paceibacterota bacterium]|jgi:hypothetical protein